MIREPVVTRFAPSPTGQMHMGNARTALFNALLARLEREGRAYPCFCTPRELELARAGQLAAGKPPRYSGRCRELPASEVASRRAAGQAATLTGERRGHFVAAVLPNLVLPGDVLPWVGLLEGEQPELSAEAAAVVAAADRRLFAAAATHAAGNDFARFA